LAGASRDTSDKVVGTTDVGTSHCNNVERVGGKVVTSVVRSTIVGGTCVRVGGEKDLEKPIGNGGRVVKVIV
jgi:hypothetical protein